MAAWGSLGMSPVDSFCKRGWGKPWLPAEMHTWVGPLGHEGPRAQSWDKVRTVPQGLALSTSVLPSLVTSSPVSLPVPLTPFQASHCLWFKHSRGSGFHVCLHVSQMHFWASRHTREVVSLLPPGLLVMPGPTLVDADSWHHLDQATCAFWALTDGTL